MKTLELNQMEAIQGGASCGKAGAAMSVAGGILGIVALCNPVTGIIGGLALGYSIAFGTAGIGCGLAELLS